MRSPGEAHLTDPELAAATSAWALVLDAVLHSAPTDLPAWHPLGLTDAEGFLALACNELLVHADDVARAHGGHPSPEAAPVTSDPDRTPDLAISPGGAGRFPSQLSAASTVSCARSRRTGSVSLAPSGPTT